MTQEEKAKAYDEALKRAKLSRLQLLNIGEEATEIEYIFPELKKESEDEKVKRIIHSISNKISFHLHDIFTEEEFQCFDAWSNAWLKKQNKHQQLYIRFGNIPSNEKSKIYRGEEEFGYENGVSVYPAFEDVNGNIVLGLSLPITKTTLYTQQHLIEYDDRLCYLVKGDYVGKGTDGEPLIKNVRIIKEIKPYRMKQDKENNIYIINNTPNCNISVYNEELKESEDERIRKALIKVFSNREKYLIDQSFGDITVSEALAWLEKQGEQMPADKVEPKFKVKYAGSEYNVFETKDIAGVTFYGIEDEPNHIDYVKAENCEIISVYAIKENGSPYPTKPAVFSEKKPKRMISAEAKEAMYDKPACAWSEEDELVVEDIEEAVINYWHGQSQEDLLDWLKSLKQRMEEQQ